MPSKKLKKTSLSLADIEKSEALDRRKRLKAEKAAAAAKKKLEEARLRREELLKEYKEQPEELYYKKNRVTMDARRKRVKTLDKRLLIESRKQTVPVVKTYRSTSKKGILLESNEEKNFINFLLDVSTTDGLDETELGDLLELFTDNYTEMRKRDIIEKLQEFPRYNFNQSRRPPKGLIIRQRQRMVDLVETLPSKYMKKFLIMYVTNIVNGGTLSLRNYYKDYVETNKELQEYLDRQVDSEDVEMRLETLFNKLKLYGMTPEITRGLDRLGRENPEISYGIQKIFDELEEYDYENFVYEYENTNIEDFNDFVDEYLYGMEDPIENFEYKFIDVLRELLRIYERRSKLENVRRKTEPIDKIPDKSQVVNILEDLDDDSEEDQEEEYDIEKEIIKQKEIAKQQELETDTKILENISDMYTQNVDEKKYDDLNVPVNPYKIISRFVDKYKSEPELYKYGIQILKKFRKYIPKDKFHKFVKNFIIQLDRDDENTINLIKYVNKYITDFKEEKKSQEDSGLVSDDKELQTKVAKEIVINKEYNRILEYCKNQLFDPEWISDNVENVYIQAVGEGSDIYYDKSKPTRTENSGVWYIPTEKFFIDACKNIIGQYQFGDIYFFKSSYTRNYSSVKLAFLLDTGKFIIQDNDMFNKRIKNKEYNRILEYCKNQLFDPEWISDNVENVYIQAVGEGSDIYYDKSKPTRTENSGVWYIPTEKFFIDACKNIIGQYQFGDIYFFKSSYTRDYSSVKLAFLLDTGKFIIQDDDMFNKRIKLDQIARDQKYRKMNQILSGDISQILKDFAIAKLSSSLNKIVKDEPDYMENSEFLRKVSIELAGDENTNSSEYIRKLATLLVLIEEPNALTFREKIEKIEYTPEMFSQLMIEDMIPEIFREKNKLQRDKNIGVLMNMIIQRTQEIQEIYYNIETLGSKRTKPRPTLFSGNRNRIITIEEEKIESDEYTEQREVVNKNTLQYYKEDDLVYYTDPDDDLTYAIPKKKLLFIKGSHGLFSKKPTINPYSSKPMDREFMRWFIQTYYGSKEDIPLIPLEDLDSDVSEKITKTAELAPDFLSNVIKRVNMCVNAKNDETCAYLDPSLYSSDNLDIDGDMSPNEFEMGMSPDDNFQETNIASDIEEDNEPIKPKKISKKNITKMKSSGSSCYGCKSSTDFLTTFKEIEPKKYELVHFCSFNCLNSCEQPFLTETTSKNIGD